jgi:hypothetical protein
MERGIKRECLNYWVKIIRKILPQYSFNYRNIKETAKAYKRN